MDESANDTPAIPTHGNATLVGATLAFEHGSFIDLNAEIARLEADPSKEEAGHKTKMLARYPEFRIVLITMRAGSRWNDHKTSSRILVQLLRGQIRFHTPSGVFDMSPGHVLALDPGVVHSVDSVAESAFLLTLSAASQK